jgi:hypothetical protein
VVRHNRAVGPWWNNRACGGRHRGRGRANRGCGAVVGNRSCGGTHRGYC